MFVCMRLYMCVCLFIDRFLSSRLTCSYFLAKNGSKDLEQYKRGNWAQFYEGIFARANMSQSNKSMPTDVFARAVVAQVCVYDALSRTRTRMHSLAHTHTHANMSRSNKCMPTNTHTCA